MVPYLGSSRGESTTSKIGFSPGNVKERLASGTERTTRLMVGYEVIKVSRLLSGKVLLRYGGNFKIYSLISLCYDFCGKIFTFVAETSSLSALLV